MEARRPAGLGKFWGTNMHRAYFYDSHFRGERWICTVRIRLGFVPETEDFECDRFLIDSLMAGMEAV
jgi:hypothetical protein